MSDEMKLKQDYQDTFNEVHAPAELSRKVMNMARTENKKTAVSFARRFAAVAAIALTVFVGGNGIAYAATGNSLLKTVKVYINGSGYETQLEEKVDENGVTYYEGTFEDVEGDLSMVITDDMEFEEGSYDVTIETEGVPEVVEENGKLYLTDEDVKIDITEDLKDGKASGSYDKDEMTFKYEVTEKDGTWDLSISNGEIKAE